MPDYKTNDPKGWCGDPKRGAELGRFDIHTPGFSGVLTLKRIPIVAGYDPNGTYYGDGEPLYWYADDEGDIDAVTRAKDREDAKKIILKRYPKAKFLPEVAKLLDFEDFVRGYVTAALWSSNDNSDERGGELMDKNYDSDDIAESSMAAMRATCAVFVEENAADLELYCKSVTAREGTPSEYAGHDLWLTANGHGCGFWDRDGVGKSGRGDAPAGLGERLSKASKAFASDLYVGDDGKVHKG